MIMLGERVVHELASFNNFRVSEQIGNILLNHNNKRPLCNRLIRAASIKTCAARINNQGSYVDLGLFLPRLYLFRRCFGLCF